MISRALFADAAKVANGEVSKAGPLVEYERRIEAGDLVDGDNCQVGTIRELQRLYDELANSAEACQLDRYAASEKAGRPSNWRKKRIHFHDFMLDSHLQKHKGVPDPLEFVAGEISDESILLCLNEFMVADVADALILNRLFGHLFSNGVILVATSNHAPDNLYEVGLQRDLFLPFISTLKERCVVLEIGSSTDYRKITSIYGAENLHQALLKTREATSFTVSNHVASMDDPLVIASLLPPSTLLDAHRLRWTLCATDRCFCNPVTSSFFRCVKVLPVSRGDGIYQKGMDIAISKLNHGDWVHIFPEGSRSRDGGSTMGSTKRGVGRLVLDADNIPLVVPFVHIGMQDIMPMGAKFPRIGKMVTVLIGHPLYFDDFLMEENYNETRENLYDAVSSRIGNQLQELEVQVERLALEQSLRSQNYPGCCTEQAARILHGLIIQGTSWTFILYSRIILFRFQANGSQRKDVRQMN